MGRTSELMQQLKKRLLSSLEILFWQWWSKKHVSGRMVDIWRGLIHNRGLSKCVLFWTADKWKLYSSLNVGSFLKDIGFNVAVLLTNLSEHMPHDTRLQSFLELADSVLNYFQPYLGRIEIMGSAKRIERVYFEISESSRTQWEKPQVMEHKLFFQPL